MGKRDHLIIPDDHAHPGDNFRRYRWLGQLILDRKPEVIVKIGDSWDMPSLCSYDKGKKSFVFRNVKQDIEAGHLAESLMFDPILEYNKRQISNRRKQYKPEVIKLIGNHEHRVAKMLEYEPQWEGSVSMSDFHTRLPIKETVVPFLQSIEVDGVAYTHYFVSGVMGRPVPNARNLLAKKYMSCTMGHTHSFDFAEGVKADGKRIKGLICGSFHDKDHKSFAGPQVDDIWWNGLIYKHNVEDGWYDMEEISVHRLEEMYTNE